MFSLTDSSPPIPGVLAPHYNLNFHSVPTFVILSVPKAKKTTTDIARASLAAGSSHSYFKHALKICDGIRGTSMGRGMLGGIGGGIGEMDKMMQYRGARVF